MSSAELSPDEDGFKTGSVVLHTRAQVLNIEDALFLKIAENAKNNCPVSKALANVEIKLTTKLNP